MIVNNLLKEKGINPDTADFKDVLDVIAPKHDKKFLDSVYALYKMQYGEDLYIWCRESNNVIYYQRAPYIDDGWYIIHNKSTTEYILMKISMYGRNEYLIDVFSSLEQARLKARQLT